jgi:hypothetical protein
MTTDNDLIDRIVRGVLDSLQSPAVAVRSSAPVELVKAVPAAEPVNELRLTETVITAELLETNWKQQPRIAVASKAVLTPLARDYLKKRKIEVIRTMASGPKSSSPAANPPSAGASRWRLFVVQTHPQLERIVEESNEKGATWERTLPASLSESIVTAVSSLLRAEVTGGVILTHQPLVASCRANRHAKVRAAAISDIAGINTAHRQIGPNLYCFDPTGKSYFELRNLFRAISSGGAPAPPEGWTD